MKLSMNAKGVSLALAAAVLATAAVAGARYADPSVTIVKNADGSGFAYGTIGGTRNSAFPGEKLQCTASRTSVISSAGAEVKVTQVLCSATDRNGVTASCTSTQEQYADALNGLANDGLIDFRFNAAGSCTGLAVYGSSSLERKR
jgi:hypothetical protein